MDSEISGLRSPAAPGSGEAEPERERPRLRLHVPKHVPDPDKPPDFSYLPRFAAGAVERPDIDVPAQQTHPLAYQLMHVLDDEPVAVVAWDPKLPPERAPRRVRDMTPTHSTHRRMT